MNGFSITSEYFNFKFLCLKIGIRMSKCWPVIKIIAVGNFHLFEHIPILAHTHALL